MKNLLTIGILLSLMLSESNAATYPGAELGIPAQKMLVMFWSINCGPCRYEVEHLPGLAAEHPETTFLVLSIDPDGGDKYLPEGLPANVYSGKINTNPIKMMQNFGNDRMLIPFSSMTHSDGSICKSHIGIMGSDTLSEWVAAC